MWANLQLLPKRHPPGVLKKVHGTSEDAGDVVDEVRGALLRCFGVCRVVVVVVAGVTNDGEDVDAEVGGRKGGFDSREAAVVAGGCGWLCMVVKCCI